MPRDPHKTRALRRRKRTGVCQTCKAKRPQSAYSPKGISCRDCERARRLRHRYGLTPESWATMAKRYAGKCWVCQEAPATEVDHCHDTGDVRGLLCSSCNVSLGHFRDDPHRLVRAAYYLGRGPYRFRHDD